MLRISTIEKPGERSGERPGREIALRLEGRLIGPWVSELRESCERVLARDGRLTLDLAGVSFIDADGVALVQNLMGQVPVTNCSPFVAGS